MLSLFALRQSSLDVHYLQHRTAPHNGVCILGCQPCLLRWNYAQIFFDLEFYEFSTSYIDIRSWTPSSIDAIAACKLEFGMMKNIPLKPLAAVKLLHSNPLRLMSCRFSELESLEVAARASPISSPNRRIVAVVGVGHMDGIEKRLASRSRRCFTLRSMC